MNSFLIKGKSRNRSRVPDEKKPYQFPEWQIYYRYVLMPRR
nr:MAG TPA: hypothetical protein [Caudoviricetes sp.]